MGLFTPATSSSSSSVGPIYSIVAGRMYALPTAATSTSNAYDTGRLYTLGFPIPTACTWDRLGIYVPTGGTNTYTARLGVYEDDGGQPGDLLWEFGTMPGTDLSVNGATPYVASTKAIPAGLVWPVFKLEGSGATKPTLATASTGSATWMNTWSLGSNAANIGVARTALQSNSQEADGPLPSTFPAHAASAQNLRMWWRAA